MEGIMKTFASYARNLKTIVLAGSMLLMTTTALAQQEIDPEHFDSEPTTPAQKATTTKTHKQVATTQKKNEAPKSSHQQVASKRNPEKPKVVVVASR
jgi:hypothetical protein